MSRSQPQRQDEIHRAPMSCPCSLPPTRPRRWRA